MAVAAAHALEVAEGGGGDAAPLAVGGRGGSSTSTRQPAAFCTPFRSGLHVRAHGRSPPGVLQSSSFACYAPVHLPLPHPLQV